MKSVRKALAAVTAASALIAGIGAVPVSAQDSNIVEVVLNVSGDSGFDSDGSDYDILRDALIATDLAGAVAETDDITVFAPRDWAMIRLARDLGFAGSDEAGAFAAIAAATGYVSVTEPGLLDDVLLYHVSPGAKRVGQLQQDPVPTLLGTDLDVSGRTIIDADPNSMDAKIVQPRNLNASNGIIHTVNRVLRPIDLPPEDSTTIVDIVLAVSGDSGFDSNPLDYDLLLEALLATDLAGAVAEADGITVFAPRDGAFIRLARDLGYDGFDEAEAFAAIAAATGYVSAADPGLLDDVLLYHVSPGAKRVGQLQQGKLPTLLGPTLEVNGRRVIDADTDDRDARLSFPKNVDGGNGIIHTVNRVLRPIDLP